MCSARSLCSVTVEASFTDAPADDLSVGTFTVTAPCRAITSAVWDACDAYGLAFEGCKITSHSTPSL